MNSLVDTSHIQAMDSAHFLHPFTDFKDLNARGARVMTEAKDIYVWDSEGNRVLDAMSGLLISVWIQLLPRSPCVGRHCRHWLYVGPGVKASWPQQHSASAPSIQIPTVRNCSLVLIPSLQSI